MAQLSQFAQVFEQKEQALLQDWIQEQKAAVTMRRDLISDADLASQSKNFLSAFRKALANATSDNINSEQWAAAKDILTDISRHRAQAGFSPSETATFVFSLKQPTFKLARQVYENDPKQLAEQTWSLTTLLDKLGLYTTEVYQKSREEVIIRQQNELLELSTPVVQLWNGILALPMIGTLDSSRTQVVMETLLHRIVETGSRVAIIDITGVPTVDTLVAQHLLKTVSAARLMGAECIISGIRPQIAATIVHLGVDLGNIATKASLADAFKLALTRTNQSVSKAAAPVKSSASAFISPVAGNA